MRKTVGVAACVGGGLAAVFHLASPAMSTEATAAPPPEPPSPSEERLVVLDELPTTWNPLYAATRSDLRNQQLVFERLYFQSAVTSEIRSRLVERYERTHGGKAIALTLEPDLSFHDGHPLTAEDLCFSVHAVRDTRSKATDLWRSIFERCEVEAGRAVIHFTRIVPTPQDWLWIPVLPAHLFESSEVPADHPIGASPVGSGPYQWTSQSQDAVHLTVNPALLKPARVPHWVIRQQPSDDVALQWLLEGKVDGWAEVPISHRDVVARSDTHALKSFDLRRWWYAALNTQDGPLQDREIRLALDAVLDRRALLPAFDPEDPHPPAEPISGPFVPSSPGYNRAIRATERNLDEARAHLLAAGAKQKKGQWRYQGSPLRLRVAIHEDLAGDLGGLGFADRLRAQLEQGGFQAEVEWVRTPPEQVEAQVNIGRFDLAILAVSGPMDADLERYFHSRSEGLGRHNVFATEVAGVDAALEAAATAKTDTALHDAMFDLHQVLHEERTALFLWKLDTRAAWSTRVRANIISPYSYYQEVAYWRLDEGASR